MMKEKTPLLDEFVCFQIGIKDLYKRLLYLCYVRMPFITMFYTINCSPMLITKSVFKLIFVLSSSQTCNFPLKPLYTFGTEKN